MTTITVDIEHIDINMLSTTIHFLQNIFEQRKQKNIKLSTGFTASKDDEIVDNSVSNSVDNSVSNFTSIRETIADPLTPEHQVPLFEDEIDVDSDGVTWDERLHHASRKKTKSGKWKLKAGLKQASARLVTETENSIEHLKSANALHVQLQAEIPPEHPLHAADIDAYNKLLRKITENIREGKITSDLLQVFESSLGIQSLSDIRHDLQKIAELSRIIDEAVTVGGM